MKKKKPTVGGLKKEIKEIKAKLKSVEEDREKLRSFVKSELKKQMDCISRGEYWSPRQIVERIMTTLNGCEKFWLWG